MYLKQGIWEDLHGLTQDEVLSFLELFALHLNVLLESGSFLFFLLLGLLMLVSLSNSTKRLYVDGAFVQKKRKLLLLDLSFRRKKIYSGSLLRIIFFKDFWEGLHRNSQEVKVQKASACAVLSHKQCICFILPCSKARGHCGRGSGKIIRHRGQGGPRGNCDKYTSGYMH